MPRSARHLDLTPEETTQRRLAEAEESRRQTRRKSATGPAGATGSTGPTGPEGRYGELHYKFSTTQTAADPGAGFFRLNKAPVSESPTQLYISETDADGAATEGLLHTWGLSSGSPKGYLLFRKRGVPATWAFYKLKSIWTDEGTWDSYAEIEKISSEGTWSNNDEFFIDFIPTGDKGATGSTGGTGPEGPKGEKGETGAKGEGPGLAYNASTSTTASNPGGGVFRLNNAGVKSATRMYISETEFGGANVASYIQEWDDAGGPGNRGWLVIRQSSSSANAAIFKVVTTIADEGEWDTVILEWVAGSMTALSNGTSYTINFLAIGPKGETGSAGTNGTNGLNGKGAWTPVTDSSIKEISPTAFEKVTNVEGDATLRSVEGFTRGCYVTFSPATTNKGFGFGLNVDPATDENFTGIDYFLNCTAGGTLLLRENAAEVAGGGGAYAAGDKLAITYDGHTVRYWQNGTLLRAVQRTIGSALYMDSWWNQEGGKAENVEFGPMGERGTDYGLPYIYSTTITEAAPGKGFFRFNNATLTSATSLYISRYMLPEVAIKGLINAWDDSTSTIHGILTFRKVGDPSAYLAYTVSGTVTEKESGEWLAITGLANIISNGTFANNDEVQIEFERTGDKGSTGAEGLIGTAYRDVLAQACVLPGGTATGTYVLGNTAVVASAANSAVVLGGLVYIDPADYAVSGKVTKFRLQGMFAANATAPGATGTLKYSLRKVTATAGASGGITYTLSGALLTSSTVTGLAAGAQTLSTSASPEKIEAAALYAVCVELGTAAIAAASFVGLTVRIQVKNE